jgi:diaminopimelate epimerase
MVASGNDFILLDRRENSVPNDPSRLARWLCRRRLSVGADGLILLTTSRVADFAYRHFNADGSEASMCGNGARAACRWAAARGAGRTGLASFEIGGKVQYARVLPEGVELSLARPSPGLSLPGVNENEAWEEGGMIHTGVPHYVLFVENIDDIDVDQSGRRYRSHPRFSEGANVDFVQITGKSTIRVRTYERGVEGETLACGTGSVAAAVTSHIRKSVQSPVQVATKGGLLTVNWKENFDPILLTGDASLVFEGTAAEGASPPGM